MKSQVFKRGPVAPEMNITPLIDVVFLLLIFFMLVNNVSSQERVKIIAPHIVHPVTHKMEDQNRIIVNVTTEQGQVKQRQKGDTFGVPGNPGQIKVGTTWYAFSDMGGVTRQLEAARKKNPHLRVVLRADAALKYSAVQPVIAAIASAGIEKTDIVAYSKDKKGG